MCHVVDVGEYRIFVILDCIIALNESTSVILRKKFFPPFVRVVRDVVLHIGLEGCDGWCV